MTLIEFVKMLEAEMTINPRLSYMNVEFQFRGKDMDLGIESIENGLILESFHSEEGPRAVINFSVKDDMHFDVHKHRRQYWSNRE